MHVQKRLKENSRNSNRSVFKDTQIWYFFFSGGKCYTAEPRLSGFVGTGINSPDNRKFELLNEPELKLNNLNGNTFNWVHFWVRIF